MNLFSKSRKQGYLPVNPNLSGRHYSCSVFGALICAGLMISSHALSKEKQNAPPTSSEISEKKDDLKELREQIESLRRRGMLDDVSANGALDAAPPEYVAPLYAYLVSDLSTRVTGQILIAAGGFVGRFDRPSPALLGYRDSGDSAPWSIAEIDRMLS